MLMITTLILTMMTANADDTAAAHSTETVEVCKHYSAQRTSNLDNSVDAVKWVCEEAEIRQVTFETPELNAAEIDTENIIANANNLEKFHVPYSNIADN